MMPDKEDTTMRNNLPPVKLQLHPTVFDLMMTVLEDNAENAPDEQIRAKAAALAKNRMQYTRIYPGSDGEEYANIHMYETEAAEMIWQLLVAASAHYAVTKEYSTELA